MSQVVGHVFLGKIRFDVPNVLELLEFSIISTFNI